jgi:DNA polymerase (family 10)
MSMDTRSSSRHGKSAKHAPKPLDSGAVAKLLAEIGQRLTLAGENPYKARAYTRAAESLQLLEAPLEEIVAADRLQEVPGVGAALAGVIGDLCLRGTTARLEELRKAAPESLLELLAVPGLRTQKIAALQRIGVTSLDDLERKCRAHELADVKGFGAAFETQTLAAIDLMRRASGQVHRHKAEAQAASMLKAIQRAHPEITRITPAGDLRRGAELVAGADIVAEAPAAKGVEALDTGGGSRLWLAGRNAYGVALALATGNDEHVVQLRARAAERGLKLTDKGLFKGSRAIACSQEADLYATLGLPWIAPELREGRDEIARAERGEAPALVESGDIRGVLHCHTVASDGGDTLADMAEGARARGYSYFGLSDHSRTAHYAGGLSIDEIVEQRREVAALNKRYKGAFRIFHGIESDILEDGSLDYPDAVLAKFDFVIASVHSKFKLDRKTQTERICKAVANPFTNIIGHMTGRLLRRREGYEVDVEQVMRACAQNGVAVEINANPHRLDLDWRWHDLGLRLGCMFSVNPDAHSVAEIDMMSYGVTMARKGGLPASRIINCMELADLKAWFAKRRAHAKPARKRPARKRATA